MDKSNIFFIYICSLFLIFCNEDNQVGNIIDNLRKLEIHCDKGFYLNGNSCFKCYEIALIVMVYVVLNVKKVIILIK